MRCMISSRNKPLHRYHGPYTFRLIWSLLLRRWNETLELYRDRPARHLTGNGSETGCKNQQLLPLVYAWMLAWTKYADIFEKETTKLLLWRIYISINFMLTTPLTLRRTGKPKQHLKKKNGDLWSFRETNPSTFITRIYSLCKGRYSDKQTTKRSIPFTTFM